MTKGISPKIVADAIVSVLAFVLAHFAVNIDPELSAAIAKVLGFIAGYLASPGEVVSPVGESSDVANAFDEDL